MTEGFIVASRCVDPHGLPEDAALRLYWRPDKVLPTEQSICTAMKFRLENWFGAGEK